MKKGQPRATIRIQAQDLVLRARIVERLEGLGDLVIESDRAAEDRPVGSRDRPDTVSPPDALVQASGGARNGSLAEGTAADGPASPRDERSITPREAEVLRLLAEGLANKEIGAQLSISAHTAKFHVESLLRKLDAVNRAEAVREGIRRGLIGL